MYRCEDSVLLQLYGQPIEQGRPLSDVIFWRGPATMFLPYFVSIVTEFIPPISDRGEYLAALSSSILAVGPSNAFCFQAD